MIFPLEISFDSQYTLQREAETVLILARPEFESAPGDPGKNRSFNVIFATGFLPKMGMPFKAPM